MEPHTSADPELKSARPYTRRPFLKRRTEFADWSGLEIRLVYYPPYHSQYNPIERCWSSLPKKWNGVLWTCLSVVLDFARRMSGKGRAPEVQHLDGRYAPGVTAPNAEMKELNQRLSRSAALSKYDITIKPKQPSGR